MPSSEASKDGWSDERGASEGVGTKLKKGGSSGFNALLAGTRRSDGSFGNLGSLGFFGLLRPVGVPVRSAATSTAAPTAAMQGSAATATPARVDIQCVSSRIEVSLARPREVPHILAQAGRARRGRQATNSRDDVL